MASGFHDPRTDLLGVPIAEAMFKPLNIMLTSSTITTQSGSFNWDYIRVV